MRKSFLYACLYFTSCYKNGQKQPLDLFFQALAVQGLVADLRRWAPHSESNYPSSLIRDAYVEALGELDPTLFPDC